MAGNYPVQYSLNSAKAKLLSQGSVIAADHDDVPKKKWNYTPMFLPTDTNGYSVAHVKKRQDFLDEAIGRWKRWHLYRAVAVFCFVLAVLAATFNVIVAAVLALVGGYCAGKYVWDDYYISYQYRTRMLLEST